MITLRTPAKVNVGLWIERRRNDGYHDLRSLFFPVSLFDTLSFEKTGEGIQLTCNQPYVPCDSNNLVWKSAYLFFTYTGVRSGVKIQLFKNIPVGHGLGGGSSNASATLLGLNQLFETGLSADEMSSLALELGMDCPFFLSPQPTLVTGRGEDLTPVEVPSFEMIIYSPPFGVSTTWAYRHLRRLTKGKNACRLLLQALSQRRYEEAAGWLYNSFEEVVYKRHPELAQMTQWLRKSGAWFAGLSGSGSALFAAIPKGLSIELEEGQAGRLLRAETLESWGVV